MLLDAPPEIRALASLGQSTCVPLAQTGQRAQQARMMCRRLYLCDALLQRLAQDLQNMAAELEQFIQEEHAVVTQQHLAGHR